MGQQTTLNRTNVDAAAMRQRGYDSPERSAVLMSCSLDCIKLLNPEGQISYISHNGLCAMEVDDLDSVAGQPWWMFWPEPQQDTIRTAVESARDGKIVNFIADCPTARGTPARWDVTVQGVFEEDGALREIIAVSRRTNEPLRDLSAF